MAPLVAYLLSGTVLLLVWDCGLADNVAQLYPSDDFLEVSQPLNVSCSLNPSRPADKLTSADLSFRWALGRQVTPVKPHYMQIKNSTTVTVLLPSVDRSRDRYQLVCYTGNKARDSIYIRVGYKPKPIANVSALVDNWNMLTIRWIQGKNPVFRTTTVAYYKIPNEPFRNCQAPNCSFIQKTVLCSCSLSIADGNLRSSIFFVIKVNSSNVIGQITTQEKIFYLADINKPAAVRGLIYNELGANWAYLTWSSPAANRILVYAVNMTTAGGKGKTFTVKHTHRLHVFYNATGLLAGTTYTVTVKARSDDSSIWSNPETITLRTNDTVPYGLPVTTRGAFDVTEFDSVRHITIYWQPVPEQLRNGKITEYKIVVKSKEDAPVTINPDAQEGCIRQLRYQDPNKAYNVSVMARTSAGFNASLLSSQPQIVVLPQNLLETLVPKNVTALVKEDNLTEVYWQVEPEALYTGYWCVSNGQVCQGTINWEKNINPPWTVPTVSDPKRHRYGISADLDTSSSGISWSKCVYDPEQKSRPPSIQNTTGSDYITLSMQMSSRCDLQGGYVYAYRVSYCLLSDDHCEAPLKDLIYAREEGTTVVRLTGLPEKSSFRLYVYSLTLAGASSDPVIDVLSTYAGAKTVIMSPWVWIGSLLGVIFFIVGVIAVTIKCKRKIAEKLKSPSIRRPDQNSPEALNEDVKDSGIDIPYHNLGSPSSGNSVNVTGHGPELPPRSKAYLTKMVDGQKSGLTPTGKSSSVTVPSSGILATMPFSNPVYDEENPVKVDEQNMKNKLMDEDYNYATTSCIDSQTDDSEFYKRSRSSSSSDEDGTQYKGTALVLNRALLPKESPPNTNHSSDADEPDMSDSSYGYKPALFSDVLKPGNSSLPLLGSDRPLQPKQSGHDFTPVLGHSVPPSVPMPLLSSSEPAVPVMDDSGSTEPGGSASGRQDGSDDDYGYAPSQFVI